MKALIEAGMLLHTGEMIRAYVPIRIEDGEPRMDGLYHHLLKSVVIADLTNKKYIKHRTIYPLPSEVSDDVISMFMAIQPTDIAELKARESRWRS